ncbi:MAG: hypothetical protein UV60_C0011G0009 [Parcubacteria group bacterium GW2011_GWA2_43_11]|nr:MAG: hypothetical protein UU89_C0046G0010 [Parcubacteria group bacterium GW2011_GWC2_42_11]KKS85109.1 MAG: hypothetical protein UV60_C0011G0009 [Parcubacteria group bacterium GW2011_GWA2_43_11]
MDIFYPLQWIADRVTYNLFAIVHGTRLADGVNFFVYDTLKIFLLLFAISFGMGLINVYFPVEKVRDYLTQKKMFGLDYFLAAFFGTITPFCSCSSVPLFIGFVKGGIPLGVTLAFLISSPLVDSVVIAMLVGMFGVKTALVYVVSGIVVAMVGGYVLGKMRLERYLTSWVLEMRSVGGVTAPVVQGSVLFSKEHIGHAYKESLGIIKSVGLYVFIGVGVGAFIHGFVPVSFFEEYMNIHPLLAVPLAAIIAVPLYANAAGILPIAQVLVGKGIELGVVLSFMMAAVALSIPSGILLRKVMTMRFLSYFYGVTTFGIILLGYFYVAVL